MDGTFKPSYYNLVVPHGPYTLLFNGVTSGLMRLPEDVAREILPFLGPPKPRVAGQGREEWRPASFEPSDLPEDLREVFPEFLRGRFFVPAAEDEIIHLEERFEYFRQRDPFLVTITTTMDCNLGCYYCFEDKSPVYLSREGCDRMLEWIEGRIEEKGHETLYTEWYGGEPMLNRDAIEYFSDQAIALCERRGVAYHSSMISNGTLWPEDARGFIQRTRIRHVQITLDGPREHHDQRRRYVRGESRDESSFDKVVETIDRIAGAVRIYLRINIDRGSAPDALSLIDFFQEKGWLEPGKRVFPYLAMIGPMTEHCSFLGKSDKARDFRSEFDALDHEFKSILSRLLEPRSIQHLQYYPMTVKLNCAAVGVNSVIFGPDGAMYKCGLEVGDLHRAHGHLSAGGTKRQAASQGSPLRVVGDGPSPHPWESYDPFRHARCSQCQFLPVCMGGCPKTQFENNEFYLEQQSRYWEDNFDTIIRNYYDATTRRLPSGLPEA